MAQNIHDAAEFVRSRLRGQATRITQDEMSALLEDLKQMMGRALTATDVASVVEVFRELSSDPEPA